MVVVVVVGGFKDGWFWGWNGGGKGGGVGGFLIGDLKTVGIGDRESKAIL